MMYGFRVQKRAQRGEEVAPVGVEFDSKVTFIARKNKTLVLHMTGGTHWAGIGMDRAYHEARFVVYDVVQETLNNDGTVSLMCDEVIDFAPRKVKK